MDKKRTDANRDRATEERILAAAHAVFTRRGTAGARTQEIADEAGVNKALLHYYFRTKEQLASAVFQQAALQMFPPLVQIMGAELPLEEKIERAVHHYIDQLTRFPFLPAYLIGEMNHHPERLRVTMTNVVGNPSLIQPRMLEVLGRQIEEGVAAGTMRPIAPEQLLINIASLCIFPFAAKPMIGILLNIDDAGFERFIRRRRKELADFILGALQP